MSGGREPGGKAFDVRKGDILLRVKARPGSREDRVMGTRGGEVLVSVRAAPEKGKANVELVRVLSKFLGVSKSMVVLKSGSTSAHKLFEVPLSTRGTLEGLGEM